MLEQFFYSANLGETLPNQQFSLVSCADCGFRYHSKVIPDEWVPIVYGKWISREQIASFEAAHSHEKSSDFDQKLRDLRLIMRLRKLALAKGAPADSLSLLDFGCGDGKLIALARSMGISSFGIDVSASRTMAAHASGCPIYPSVQDLRNSVEKPFNMVVLNQALEHLKNPYSMLQSIASSMAPGGAIFVGVPNCLGIDRPRTFHEFHCVQPIEHINCFTPSSLKRFVEKRGFSQVRTPFSLVALNGWAALRSLAGSCLKTQGTELFFVRTSQGH